MCRFRPSYAHRLRSRLHYALHPPHTTLLPRLLSRFAARGARSVWVSPGFVPGFTTALAPVVAPASQAFHNVGVVVRRFRQVCCAAPPSRPLRSVCRTAARKRKERAREKSEKAAGFLSILPLCGGCLRASAIRIFEHIFSVLPSKRRLSPAGASDNRRLTGLGLVA